MRNKPNINESFICKIWENAGEYLSPLKTIDGDSIEIIDYGRKNFDSGPDYLDAAIRMDGKLHRGHVEVHQDFKDWFGHKHPADRKYVSVILQVVLWDSKSRKLPKTRIKRSIPTVILANHLKYSINHIWQDIIDKPSSKTKLPCANLDDLLDDELIEDWFSNLAIERLKLKALRIRERILEIAAETGIKPKPDYLKDKKNWEQVFYEFVFEALGYSKNKEQMLTLARKFRLRDAARMLQEKGSKPRNIKVTIQANLFGISGLLFDLRIKDEYINRIKEIWNEEEPHLKAGRLNKSDWNFFRLRPQNFPTRRIAYGAQLIIKLLEQDLLKEVILLFQNNELRVEEIFKYLSMLLKSGKDEYWSKHYNFGKESKKAANLLGAQRVDDIIINVITPVVYLYSDIFARKNLKNRVIDFYSKLKTSPDNSIVKLVQSQIIKKRNISINTPAMEQAAVQLFNFYCTRERCNECEIGKRVFKNTGYNYKIIYY